MWIYIYTYIHVHVNINRERERERERERKRERERGGGRETHPADPSESASYTSRRSLAPITGSGAERVKIHPPREASSGLKGLLVGWLVR